MGQLLTTVSDTTLTASETHVFTYDPSYRIASVAQASRGILDYTYASDDRVVTMTVAGGPTTTYAYYPDGSLDTIAWSPLAGQFKYGYTLNGQYQAIMFPNGQARSYSYDDQGRLVQLANLHPTAGTLASFAYGYDLDPQTQQPTLLGQRTSLSMTIPSQGLTSATSSYRYDNDYQLTQASYPSGAPYNGEVHGWTYDAIGNRLTNTVNGVPQTYSYFKNGSNPLNGQRLSSDSVNGYTYDANGNTVTRNGTPGSFTFGWDADDRMTSISGTVAASYGYDYTGRRTSKTVSGSTTNYLYEGLNLIHTSGVSPADYLFGPGIDEPLALSRGGSISYTSVDGLGSANLLTDTTGAVQDAYLYEAWGVIKSQTGTLANDFGYTAREFGEANLWYYRARYYQAGVGRFNSEDPLRLTSLRLFTYSRSDPVGFVDPLGLFKLPCDPKDLGPEWKRDWSHEHPFGERYTDPSGRPLRFDRGRPDVPGNRAQDHWHDPDNFGRKHLPPGTEVPDPAEPGTPPVPIVPPAVPWWGWVPSVPLPIIISPCVISPGFPGCGMPGVPGT